MSEQGSKRNRSIGSQCSTLSRFKRIVLSSLMPNVCDLRMLGAGSPYPTDVCHHPGAVNSHRGGRNGHHAAGLLPLHAGGLEGGDPGDV